MEIISAKNLTNQNYLRLIYSAPGIGKTSTVRYLSGNTLVLDVDRTTGVLKGLDNIDIVNVDTMTPWETFPKLLGEIKNNYLNDYDNIVLDNISELERSILAHLGKEGKNNRVPAIADYQRMQFMLVDAIRFLKQLNKNILITAWETTDLWTTTEGQQFNRAYPQISTKILSNVMGLSDVVARLVYNPETGNRGFYLQPNNALFAKNQIDQRDSCLQSELFFTDDSAT